eukprot:SAG22_NODE_1913_length_3322_cov_2.699969_7_plen_93_part_00
MMELKKERLSKQTKLILCLGFSGLIAGFLALFFVLMYVTVKKECSDPWFHQTEHFSNSEAPRCGMLKRCGNIGQPVCRSDEKQCWLEELVVS